MNAKLIIAGEERWLSNFHYEYFYPLKTPDNFPEVETYDMLVRPCDGPDGPLRYQLAGGLFNLSFASTEQDEFFWEWLMLGSMKEGRFELYKGDDEHFMKIEFWDCYCVGFHESMTLGSSPMQISLRLSPAITRNRKVVKHEKSWKVSDLNGAGNTGNAGNAGMAAAGSTVAEEVPAKLVSVELIDSNNNAVEGFVMQYVNLPSNAAFVNGKEVQDIGQLGQNIRCKVVFDKPGVHNFKLKLEPGSKNLVYSASEKSRNANFKHQDQELNLSTNSNGEIIVEGRRLFVSPGSGDIFSVAATDDSGNKLLSNGFIQTERLLHYVEVKMNNLKSIASNLNPFVREFKRNGVILKDLPSVNMPHLKNIDTRADVNTFLQNIQTALVNSPVVNYNPHCVTIAYTDHLAVKKVFEVEGITRGGADGKIKLQIADLRSGDQYALWHNLDGTDWLVSCEFKPADGSKAIPIGIEKCKIYERVGFTGLHDTVEIDVSTLPRKQGKIEMKVNIVDRMRGGLSFGNKSIVAICTRSWWRNVPGAQQNHVAIHEVGHQVGMTSDGAGIKPDKVPTYYNNSKGHVGPHCHYGIPAGQARYDARRDLNRSRCVMYGAVNGHSSFCDHCSDALKKADLKNGL